MPPRFKKSIALLLVLGLTTLAAEIIREAGWDVEASAVAEPVVRLHREESKRDEPKRQFRDDLAIRLASLSQRTPAESGEVADLFEPQSWQPPAPPPAPPPPPPKPTAPPLPYTYMGSLLDGSERLVFLSSSDRVIAVKPGDKIDDAYQIDSITNEKMILTYLPMREKQTVVFGERR